MRSRLIPLDAPEWSSVLATTPHDVYHLPGYVAATARHEGGEPVAVYVEEKQQGRLLLPLILCRGPGGRVDARSPYGYSGPIVDDPRDDGFAAAAMAAAVATLRDADIASLLVRLHPLRPLDGLGQVGTLVLHGETVVIDLARSDEEIWRGMRQNHRRDIRRSERDGHEFRFERSPDAYAEYYDLYRSTMIRREASDFYFFAEEYFEELIDALGERLQLATVLVDGRMAAAGLFTETSGIVQLHLAGWDNRPEARGATKRMYFEVSKWAKGRGNRWFHLGGGLGGTADSLLHFKAGFSCLRGRFETLRVVVNDEVYRELLRDFDPAADPSTLSRFFPAYREPSNHPSEI